MTDKKSKDVHGMIEKVLNHLLTAIEYLRHGHFVSAESCIGWAKEILEEENSSMSQDKKLFCVRCNNEIDEKTIGIFQKIGRRRGEDGKRLPKICAECALKAVDEF